MNVCVVGLGEVGSATFSHFVKKQKDSEKMIITGVDINPNTLETMRIALDGFSFELSQNLPTIYQDYYIICVYSTQQVKEVIALIAKSGRLRGSTVIIESTVLPGTYTSLKEEYFDTDFNLVLFPHRFNPNDPAHEIFNLERIMGAEHPEECFSAHELYGRFLEPGGKIHYFDPEVVELAKPLENAYRFMEIVMAQEIKRACDAASIDFDSVRKAMNTKWNIDVKEARDGVGGKCLPKDIKLCAEFFASPFFQTMINWNEQYKGGHR